MAKDVLCEVNSCKYWGHGNMCHADAIYVISSTNSVAETTDHTGCQTFVPSEEYTS